MVAGAMLGPAHRLAGGADPAQVWPGGAGTEGPPPDRGSPLCSLLWQNLGWTLMEDGSIRIEEATEEALGTYTCVPYNTLGTMGQSAPARLVLKVRPRATSGLFVGRYLKCPPSQTCCAFPRIPRILRCYQAGSTGRRPAGSYSYPALPQGTPSLSSHGERYLWVLELLASMVGGGRTLVGGKELIVALF